LDCGGGFFYNHHGQFVNDGGAIGGIMAFHHGPPSAIDNTAKH